MPHGITRPQWVNTVMVTSWDPFYWRGLTLIPAWISNYICYKVWDEMTFQFLNINCATVDVWQWICNFIQHFTGHMVSYPCWDFSQSVLVKQAPGCLCCYYLIYCKVTWHLAALSWTSLTRSEVSKTMKVAMIHVNVIFSSQSDVMVDVYNE